MDTVQQFLRDLGNLWATYDVAQVAIELVLLAIATYLVLRFGRRSIQAFIAGVMDRRDAEDTAAHLSATEKAKRLNTIESLAVNVLSVAVVIVAVVIALAVLKVDIGPAIAGLGFLGLGIGLGLQNLVKDLVAGTMIIVENQYAQGDIVRISGVRGTVEELGLRRTVLRGSDGTVHNVPNGLIQVASNETRVWGRVMLDVPVANAAELSRARAEVEKVAADLAADPEWKGRFLDAPRISGVKSMTASEVVLTLVATVVAADRDLVAGELRGRIVEAFAEHGIGLGATKPPA